MMPDQVRKWLRQQSKDLYAAGFDVLVKLWDKCISVGGGYVGYVQVTILSRVLVFLDGVWIGYLDLLTPYTLNS
jgi:hypothetical protein